MGVLRRRKEYGPEQGTFTTLSILFALVMGFGIAMAVLRWVLN